MRRETLPVILGMSPPRYSMEVGTTKAFRGAGRDIMLVHAKFPEGTERGCPEEPTEVIGLGAWLHFTDPDVMRMFGRNIVNIADEWELEDGESEQAQATGN